LFNTFFQKNIKNKKKLKNNFLWKKKKKKKRYIHVEKEFC